MRFLSRSSCVLCGDTVFRQVSLCEPCEHDMPKIAHSCQQCGIPLEASVESRCGKCLKIPPLVDYTLSVYHYESPINYLIHQLKFKHQLSYAAIMGLLFNKSLKEQGIMSHVPEVILPMPLHKRRLVERGFNQSLEIARPVAKMLQIGIDTDFVRRIKETSPQTALTVKERKKNIKNCFEVKKQTKYKHVVILDDVVTTGASTNELARVLKKAGVKTVGVWSIARAVLSIA